MRATAPLAALLLLLLAAALPQAAAEEAPLGEGDSLVDMAFVLCSSAPDSEACREVEAIVRAQTIDALYTLGRSGRRDQARPLVLAYINHAEADIRAAAVAALAGLYPSTEDTPALALRLNDPVPAVRTAALAALSASSDPDAIVLVDRSRPVQGTSLQPDPAFDPGVIGVSLPPGAEPLRFAKDGGQGVLAFVTDQNPQQVAGYYSRLTGQPAISFAKFKNELLPDWAKVAGMPFYQQLGPRMESLGSLPTDQQMIMQIRLGMLLGLQQSGELADIERWEEEALWGDVRAMVLTRDPMLEMPALLLFIYKDRGLGRTGFALQWLPAQTMPAFSTTEEATEITKPEAEVGDSAAIEAFLWRAVQTRGTEADYRAYLAALPDGPHASEAHEALRSLEAQSPAPAPTPTPAPAPVSPPAPAPVQPTGQPVLLVSPPIAAGEPIVITFSGLPGDRGEWITVVPAGQPDNHWGDWAYTRGATSGQITLPGQRRGDYELRAYVEAPQQVLVRLAITIGTPPSGPPSVALIGEVPKAGQPIHVAYSNLPGAPSDWIALSPAGSPDSSWVTWKYTGGGSDGEVSLLGQPAGDYELRAYAERPNREVLARLPVTIAP